MFARGLEAERLAVYFEESAAHEYREYKKHETSSSSNASDEVTEFVLDDAPADVWTPDEED